MCVSVSVCNHFLKLESKIMEKKSKNQITLINMNILNKIIVNWPNILLSLVLNQNIKKSKKSVAEWLLKLLTHSLWGPHWPVGPLKSNHINCTGYGKCTQQWDSHTDYLYICFGSPTRPPCGDTANPLNSPAVKTTFSYIESVLALPVSKYQV